MTNRRGITVTEVVCSAVLTAVVLSTLVPGVYWVRRQNKAAAQHLDAITAVNNVLDNITAREFDEVTPDALATIEVPGWIAERLSESALNVTSAEAGGGKRITAELSWLAATGAARESVRLHAWVFDGRVSK